MAPDTPFGPVESFKPHAASLPGRRFPLQRAVRCTVLLWAVCLLHPPCPAAGQSPAEPLPPESDNQAARPNLTAIPTVRWLPRPTPLTQSEAKTEAQMKRYEEPVPGAKRPMAMVPIRGGRFRMGTPPSEPSRKADEGPQHEVEIAPF